MRTTDPARRRCAQNADHLALNSPFSAFFTEVVCTLSAAPPRTATSLPQNGGNDIIRAATRRRHAASQLLMLHPPAGQIGNQRRAYSPRLVPNCGAGGRGQDLAGLQNDADHPPAHQAPPVWRATRELRDKRGLAVGLGGGARGRRGLDGMCTAMKSPTGVEGTGGSGGLGRASRSTTPSRRLACGDLAGGPPPTGTHSPTTTSTHNATRPRPVSRPRPRRAQSVPLRTTALRRSVPLSKAAPPAIRRSCPRGPRPRRGQPRGGRRGRGTGSRTRSQHPRCGRSG